MAQTQIATGFNQTISEWIETVLSSAAEQVKSGPATVYAIDIDNTIATSTQVYVKGYFLTAGAVTPGTTPADLVLPCPGVTRLVYVLIYAGTPLAFPIALTMRCTQNKANSDVTAPSQAVAVRVVYS